MRVTGVISDSLSMEAKPADLQQSSKFNLIAPTQLWHAIMNTSNINSTFSQNGRKWLKDFQPFAASENTHTSQTDAEIADT